VTDDRDAPGAGGEQPSALPVVRQRGPRLPAVVEGPLDIAVGAAVVVARPAVAATAAVSRSLAPVARSVWGLVSRPPLVPERFTAGYAVDRLTERGRAVRFAAGEDLTVISDDTLDYVVPEVLVRVLDRIDLTQLVLQRVDLERIVTEVLDRLDLTEVVLQRVDLAAVVNSAVESVDLNTLIRTQVDVAGLAEEVIDEVDLPEIIRDSTSGVATVVVDSARLSAVSGDELVNRWVDRILLRRKARSTEAPGDPQSMRGRDE
jgi:hypothetical protein